MLNELKSTILDVKKSLNLVTKKFEDKIEDIEEDSKKLLLESKKHLHHVNKRLDDSVEYLDSASDEALLQAHLALMDAADQWDHVKEEMSSFLKTSQQSGQPLIDRSLLQASLAKMEARDFMAGPGKALVGRIQKSKSEATKASLQAVAGMKKAIDELLK